VNCFKLLTVRVVSSLAVHVCGAASNTITLSAVFCIRKFVLRLLCVHTLKEVAKDNAFMKSKCYEFLLLYSLMSVCSLWCILVAETIMTFVLRAATRDRAVVRSGLQVVR
jgi:hypothetical protein